jgi:hypothetical protein
MQHDLRIFYQICGNLLIFFLFIFLGLKQTFIAHYNNGHFNYIEHLF